MLSRGSEPTGAVERVGSSGQGGGGRLGLGGGPRAGCPARGGGQWRRQGVLGFRV